MKTAFRILVLIGIAISGQVRAAENATAIATRPASEDAIRARSLVSTGDTTRLQRVFAKAARGEPITVGVIGGSITAGAAAGSVEGRYGNLVAEWWRKTFPAAKVTFVNAGIGATGSSYGAFRVRGHLLSHRPDFVVVEFAVNDGNTRECAETLEGLVRQTLKSAERPAVVLLFTMHQNGGNAQEWHSKIGRHYGLPMISFRDALWPEIQAGRMKWEDVEADIVHPNTRGHAYAAEFITSFLEQARKAGRPQSPVASSPGDAALLPRPLISDVFEHVALWEDDLRVVSNKGWTHYPKDHCWRSEEPGSVIEFEVEGTAVATMHWVIRGPMGRAKASVDGGPAKQLEGWFDATWGGYRQTTELARGLPDGKHRVRIEVLPEKSDGSAGHQVSIVGIGAAGMKE